MSYEIYREQRSKENYFNSWEDETVKTLTDELKERIYKKYLVKCDVFQRDNFECQNLDCMKTSTQLTLHHIKFQKNGGEDKAHNCVTLCLTCHKAFHRAKRSIMFSSSKSLPSHIKGKTFRLESPDSDGPNWKQVKFEMRKFRKTLKTYHNITLTWAQISILLKFLEMDFE